MALQFPTRAERPGHLPHTASLRERAWPEFMYHDPVLERLFGRVIAEDAEFRFYAWDDEREEVVGVGMAVPASWDGDDVSLPDGGLDAVVEARFAGASSEADRALRDADPDRARVPGPGSEHSHDPADDRDPSRPRPRHADRSGPADPKALVPARSAGAIHQLAPPGQDSPRPMAIETGSRLHSSRCVSSGCGCG